MAVTCHINTFVVSHISVDPNAKTCHCWGSICIKDVGWLRDYVSFCKGLDIPASEDLLIAWASTYTGRLAGKNVRANISAIKREHLHRGLLWQGGKQLCIIMKGIEEMRPASSYHVKRAPVMIQMLTDISWALNRSSGLDNCICAICCLAFFCQLCIGELLPSIQDIQKFDATFVNIAKLTSKTGACNLHLPGSKTQKACGDDV